MRRATDLVVALATLFVALATLALVWVTRDVAQQTRAAAQATVRPILADVRPGERGEKITYDHMFFPMTVKLRDSAAMDIRTFLEGASGTASVARSIAVRNIGNGPALVKNVQLHIPKGREEQTAAWASPSTLAAGETGRLMTLDFKNQLLDPNNGFSTFNRLAHNDWGFTITAEYTDTEGKQRQALTVRVVPNYYKVGGLHVAAFNVRDD
jgi:hypothetical protein